MNILIQYYKTDRDRDNEFLYCINRNLSLPQVEKIYVFCEDAKININNPKLVIINHNRMKYIDFIRWSNENLKDKVCCIMNTDIYFDNSLKYLSDEFITQDKFIVLTRYDVGSNIKFYANHRSNDVWIYRTPMKEIGDYYLGIPHCDGRIVYEAYINDYTIYNPSKLIYCYHLHNQGHRNWKWNFDYIYGEVTDTNWTSSLIPCELKSDFVNYPCNVELIKYLDQCENKNYIEIGPSEFGIGTFLPAANWNGDLYEPNEKFYNICLKNYKNYSNINIHNIAISDRDETNVIFYNSNKNSSLDKNYIINNNFTYFESIVSTKKLTSYVDLVINSIDNLMNFNSKFIFSTIKIDYLDYTFIEEIDNLFIYKNKKY
jgi:hypothetical protein